MFAGTLGKGLYVYERESERWFAIERGPAFVERDRARRSPMAISTSARTTVWFAYRSRSCIHEENDSHAFRHCCSRLGCLLADAGILIPRDKAQPDPAILSLEEMEITIRIDNGDARVFVRQIFANHTGKIEEGNYIFALPSQATVSDFAVWDGPDPHSGRGSRTQARRGNLHPAQAAGD